ncbi:SDR family oxidoreductase [Mycobacterium colombiense]|uniref:SDR family oxidoreductase n=1 Tax=Mycobacterium colombiense TaxID=339268 RepID=UPI00200A070A|nr:SDR family oxidoreductase [Mycobacterium colombiense]MCK8642397.1 SDR family oxidoreductase [Mycobacterium colombiense]
MNKVVAITGGARGIGFATARALVHEGARVAIGDLNGDLAVEAAASLGSDAFGFGVDVSDNAQFIAFLDEVGRRLGPLDVLVNNAGIMTTGPIEDEDEEMTAREIAINLHAVIHGTRQAVQRMKDRRSGHIVNVSSVGGRIAGARIATYCATKFGIAGFSEAVALELKGSGVEISVVFPPPCKTDMSSGLGRVRGMPFVEPEDVAARIVETLKWPRFAVPVPKTMGPMLWLSQALPFRARAALAHITKADDFRVNEAERAAYARRLQHTMAALSEPPAAATSEGVLGMKSTPAPEIPL